MLPMKFYSLTSLSCMGMGNECFISKRYCFIDWLQRNYLENNKLIDKC